MLRTTKSRFLPDWATCHCFRAFHQADAMPTLLLTPAGDSLWPRKSWDNSHQMGRQSGSLATGRWWWAAAQLGHKPQSLNIGVTRERSHADSHNSQYSFKGTGFRAGVWCYSLNHEWFICICTMRHNCTMEYSYLGNTTVKWELQRISQGKHTLTTMFNRNTKGPTWNEMGPCLNICGVFHIMRQEMNN